MTDNIEGRARAALEGVTPGPYIVTKKVTQIGMCYWVKAQAHADLKHGGAILYDDRTSLNPHAHGEVKANAHFYAACHDLVPAMADEMAALRAERDALRDRLGATRMCVACGASKPADLPKDHPAPGCDGVACTWDMTPQEAADHWRQKAHALQAKLAEAVEALRELLAAYEKPDERICCNGRECGCHGVTIHQCAEYCARATLARMEENHG